MKCKYCNAEIEQDALFCPNCGKDLSKFNKCVKCGELLDNETAFCPHCGAEQPRIEEVVEGPANSNKWFWIVGAILLIGVLAGGGYYFMGNRSATSLSAYSQETDSIEEIVDSTIVDIHSTEGINARLNEIFSKGLRMSDEDVVKTFFSEEFRNLYRMVDEVDRNRGEIGFWNGGLWDGRQDDDPNAFEIVRIYTSSPQEADIVVNLIFNLENRHSEAKVSMSLVFENGNWFIDDISDMRYKDQMKDYIKESSSTTYSKTISNGTYSMAGKVSKYSIHMNIEVKGTNVSGYYYYDSQGSGNTVKLSGTINEDGELTLKKFSKDNEETGYFEGVFNGVEYSGKNVNYNRDEDLQFSVSVE